MVLELVTGMAEKSIFPAYLAGSDILGRFDK
jgi:hypothetical protein